MLDKTHRQGFWLAVQFMTRLPVPRSAGYSARGQAASAAFYPLIGVILGGLSILVLIGASYIWAWPVAVALAVITSVKLTGALHEDGLADMADGLGGGRDRTRALEIMRDSRLGVFGAVSLVLALGLKLVLLLAMPFEVAIFALLGGAVVARFFAVHVIASTGYARSGAGKFLAPTVSTQGYVIALVTLGFTLCFILPALGVGRLALGFGLSAITAQMLRARYVGKLGGYTGDCLGGTIVVAELAFLLGVSAWL